MQSWKISDRKPRQIAFLLFPRFSNHVLANALEPLRAANTFLGQEIYRWKLLSPDGAPVHTSAGMRVTPDAAFGNDESGDTLVLLPSYGYANFATPSFNLRLRAASGRFHSVIGLDSGAWLMAAAGLLAGHRATIHYDELDRFAETFPDIAVERARWIDEGNRATAAGAVAAFELVMARLAQAHGAALTLEIGALFSATGEGDGPLGRSLSDPHVRRAIATMEAEVEKPRPIEEIASAAGCNQRTLETRFQRSFGASPQKIYRWVRLTAARRMIRETTLSITEIAGRTGYEDASAFARAFKAEFGQSPRAARAQ